MTSFPGCPSWQYAGCFFEHNWLLQNFKKFEKHGYPLIFDDDDDDDDDNDNCADSGRFFFNLTSLSKQLLW